MRSIELRELMAIAVDVRPVVDLGAGRRFVAFDGGTFAGRDGLAGTLLEGGVDWQTGPARRSAGDRRPLHALDRGG